jgi:uncharacterized protein (DUF302 family)
MTSGTEIGYYLIPRPCAKAAKILREALNAVDLEILAELDLSERIERKLGIKLAPCTVWMVNSPTLLLEALTLHKAAPLYIPVRIVLSARGSATGVHILNFPPSYDSRLPPGIRASLSKLQIRITQALEAVSKPESIAERGTDMSKLIGIA